jgi:hypothetical protein
VLTTEKMCRTSLLSMWLKNHDPTVSVFSHEVDATCVAQNKQLTFRSEMSMIDFHLILKHKQQG